MRRSQPLDVPRVNRSLGAESPGTGVDFGQTPRISRCPHCGVGRPQVEELSDFGIRGNRRWATYTTTCCGGVLLAVGSKRDTADDPPPIIETIYPGVRSAAVEIPDPARTYLQQALETLHAPDAAAVMAGSAVDAMLKNLGLIEGSVYSRIEQAVRQHILTAPMGEWAHEVRLGSNRPRHADTENPHVSPHQAEQSVEFAAALGHFLFVLSSRVEKGIEAAKADEAPPASEPLAVTPSGGTA
jgi:hypothetical protein